MLKYLVGSAICTTFVPSFTTKSKAINTMTYPAIPQVFYVARGTMPVKMTLMLESAMDDVRAIRENMKNELGK